MSTLRKGNHVLIPGLFVALAACLVFTGSTAAVAESHEVCAEGVRKIQRLGTGGSYSPSRDAIATWEELTAFFGQEKIQAEIVDLLTGTEWEQLLEPLGRSLASRDGFDDGTWSVKWTEDAMLKPGTTVDWMVYRGKKSRKAYLGQGPFCMETAKPYESWGLEVVKKDVKKCESITRTTWSMVIPEICANLALENKSVTKEPVPKVGAVCKLEVERSCGEGAFKVDASGSSSGVKVTSSLGEPVSLDDRQRGEVDDPDPFTEATFRAVVELADECAEPPTCKESFTVEAEERPYCEISAPEKARAGTTFAVELAGYGEDAEVTVTDEDGKVVATVDGPFPTDLSLAKPGIYTLTGTAETACGSDSCSTTVKVPPRWTIRGFPLFFLGDDSSRQARNTQVNPEDVLVEEFALSTDSGNGLGVSAEYRASDRIGVEFGLFTGEVDSELRVEQALLWGGELLYQEGAVVSEDIDLQGLTVGLNLHLTPDSKVDFFVGPLIGLAQVEATYDLVFLPQDDLTQNRSVQRDSDEFFFGAQVGVDIPIGKSERWAFHLGAMYIDLATDGLGGEVKIGPVVAKAGLAFRF